MVTKTDLFEDIAIAIESWASAASEAMTSPDANLQWVDAEEPYKAIQQALEKGGVSTAVAKAVLSECFRGFAVSILSTLDGATALAEKGRVYLVDDRGRRFVGGLHDDFVSYLLESGRLT
jgi:hypothetical protein